MEFTFQVAIRMPGSIPHATDRTGAAPPRGTHTPAVVRIQDRLDATLA